MIPEGIQNEKSQYKQLVHNCANEVNELTKTNMWYFVSGKNVVDQASRGCFVGSNHQRERTGSMAHVGCYSKFQFGQYLK